LPLYTRYLTPSDYGVAALIETTLTVFGIILGLGVLNGLLRFYHEPKDQREKNRVVSTTFWITFVAAAVSIIFMVSISAWISDFLFKTDQYRVHIVVAAIAFALGMPMDTGLAYLRIKEQSSGVVILSVANTLTLVGLNIYLLVILNLGLIGIFYSMLISRLLFSTALTAYILMRVGLRFSLPWARSIITFSFPLIFSHIFRVATQESDKYFINYYFSPVETGIYSISQKIATAVHMLITVPFLQSYIPKQFDLMHQENAAATYALVLNYYLLAIVSLGLLLAMFSEEILHIMAGEQYYQSAVFIPLLILSWITFGSKYHFEIGMLICKKTSFIAYINAVSAITNIGLNFILIPRLGIWGAVIALNLSCLMTSMMNCWVSQRFYTIPFDWKFVARLGAVTAFVFVLSMSITTENIVYSIMLKTVCVIINFGLLTFINVLEKDKLKKYGKLIWNGMGSRT